jgi:uncharacterized protein (DUF305 family)
LRPRLLREHLSALSVDGQRVPQGLHKWHCRTRSIKLTNTHGFRTFSAALVAAVLATAALLLSSGVGGANGHGGGMNMDGGSMQMGGGDMMGQMNSALSDLEQLEGKKFEIAYVNQIIAHHKAALEMAHSVVDRAPNPEVRDAAAKIIDDQQKEIDELTTFLQQEYGQKPDPDERMSNMPGMMRQMDNADPATAGKMFLLMMREHHEIAMQMGQIAQDKAKSQPILDQATTMIETQSAEQEEFAGYLQQFYGIDAPKPTGDMMRAMQLAMDGGTQMPDTGGLPLVPIGAAALAAGAYALRRLALG